jgi:cellulose synthase/poly-beta-1,6-N-acetylglucosamine synthase-like glycosyltransferase
MTSVSVGIPAYNEANNIGSLLRALSKQELRKNFSLKEIVVVASGCTDGTEKIVKKSRESDPRVRLIVESERRGKASAMNILLQECASDILVLEAADTLPKDKCLHYLLSPFENRSVGATSSRPIPVNPENSVMGLIPHVIWNLYHYMAESRNSRNEYFHISGEACAFRTGIVELIPEKIVNDDAYIGLEIKRAGYKVVYVPEAIVSMKGPTNIFDLISQRRRIVYGHMQLEKSNDAYIPSIKPYQIIKVLPKILNPQPKKFLATTIGIGSEALSHMLAKRDIQKGKYHYKWHMVQSTKSLTAG